MSLLPFPRKDERAKEKREIKGFLRLKRVGEWEMRKIKWFMGRYSLINFKSPVHTCFSTWASYSLDSESDSNYYLDF